MAAASAKNNSDLRKLYDNISLVQKSQDTKISRFLSTLEKELFDLQFHNISNLKFENRITNLNLMLKSLQELLYMFIDTYNIFIPYYLKDEKFLRIKNLFKTKFIDFSKLINTGSGNIMRNSSNHNTKKKTIFDLLNLQNELNDIYNMYEISLGDKNTNKSARNLIKGHHKNIENKYKNL
jgi:hypothetical protein